MNREEEPSLAAYVVVGGQSVDWAIEAEAVREIVLLAEWRGAAPFDVAALWGDGSRDEAAESRVIVVDTQGGPRGIRAARIAYRSLARAHVFALPGVMARSPAAAFVTGLVFDEAHPALVILNPEGLSYESPE